MNYFELVKRADPAKTAIIEDGKAYTYSRLLSLVSAMAEQILKNQEYNGNILKIQNKNVFIIKENSILKQLVAFLACNAVKAVPMIVPSDAMRLPEINYVPEDACMAVMTSGTTGIPKILYRTYKSWAGFFPVQNEIFGINGESVLFAQGSLAFTGNLNLYMAQFYAEGTVVAENKFNPRRWAHVIKKERVNSIYLIPSKLMLLPYVIKEINKDIKSVISGSQSLGVSDAIRLKELFPVAEITLYYGASELNYITYVKDKDMTTDKNLIGKPFPGVRVSVNNGNIYVDSQYHAEGIKCPYTVSDKGYMDKDGSLYFEGRSDDIVSIHGRKVSLIHIENELESLEEVHEAAVIYIIENEKQVLAAFIDMEYNIKDSLVINNNNYSSIKQGENISILKKLATNDEIFTSLRKRLAHYEMPCKIIELNEIPHNGSGKKDKKKIQKLYKSIGRRVSSARD
ncbi:MAG: long-chain fatty acid--CoA ligase [Lachnospiraceae bacterium]|nr:long-chain fatty acid--CoA ligase [Lachnospiraceae bacterium]